MQNSMVSHTVPCKVCFDSIHGVRMLNAILRKSAKWTHTTMARQCTVMHTISMQTSTTPLYSRGASSRRRGWWERTTSQNERHHRPLSKGRPDEGRSREICSVNSAHNGKYSDLSSTLQLLTTNLNSLPSAAAASATSWLYDR